jgi:uncharacterized protein YbaP (TraB family)
MFKLLLCFILLISNCYCKCSQNKSRHIHLWHVKDDTRQASIFLFGTIHISWNEIWPHVHPHIRAAFDASDTVILELVLNNPKMAQMLHQCRDLPLGVSLKEIIGKKIFSKLKKFLEMKRANLTAAVLSHHSMHMGNHAQILLNFQMTTTDWKNKRPVWLLFMLFHLLNMDDKKHSTTPMLDMFLATEAQRYGKNIHSLESPAEQCNPLENISDKDIAFAIDHTLNYLVKNNHKFESNHQNINPVDGIIEKYKCGELDDSIFETTQFLDVKSENSVMSNTIQQQIRQKMFTVRNERMAKRLHDYFKTFKNESIFVAIGAAHFIGDSNVIDELKRIYPYKITSIKNDDIFDSNFIKSKHFHLQSDFKSFRNLWERDETPIKYRQKDFIIWKQEYPSEIFHSSAFSLQIQLPHLILFTAILSLFYY